MGQIDNLDIILPLLDFRDPDDFYFLSLIQRKKDITILTGRNNSSRCVKNYYINSQEYLINKYDEIKQICDITKARASINLNVKSYKKVSLETLGLIADYIKSEQYLNAKRAFDSACGNSNTTGPKRWIVDIDHQNKRLINEMLLFIEKKCDPEGVKYVGLIPSKSGFHLITSPFNTKTFKDAGFIEDIQKDNPTNLYIP